MTRPSEGQALEDRFWAKVSKAAGDDCWEWQGWRTSKGYGRMKVSGRKAMASNIALAIAGRPLAPKECALHRCDNPPCVRASHLFVGTRTANNADKVAKGRQAKGRAVSTNRLTEADVREIRRLYGSGGYSQPELAASFGVRHSTIGYITRGETWRWLL